MGKLERFPQKCPAALPPIKQMGGCAARAVPCTSIQYSARQSRCPAALPPFRQMARYARRAVLR